MNNIIKRIKRDLKFYPNSKLQIYQELDETIPQIYVPVNSDIQISTIYKNYLKNKTLYRDYYYSLLILISKQYNIEEEKFLKLLKNKDIDIYRKLKKIRGPYINQNIKFINPQIRKCILSRYTGIIKNYLDVGCLDGKKTEMTGKYLGLKKSNIFCLNLNRDEQFKGGKISKYVNFKTYNGEEEFPFKDNSFSLLTYDSVLHHVKNIDHVLKESFRVLKKGGLLLIREHDARTDFDKLLCDIAHIYYSKLENLDEVEKTGNYISWPELNYLITEHGFILKNHIKDPSYKNEINNVTRTYFSLYQK